MWPKLPLIAKCVPIDRSNPPADQIAIGEVSHRGSLRLLRYAETGAGEKFSLQVHSTPLKKLSARAATGSKRIQSWQIRSCSLVRGHASIGRADQRSGHSILFRNGMRGISASESGIDRRATRVVAIPQWRWGTHQRGWLINGSRRNENGGAIHDQSRLFQSALIRLFCRTH